MNVAIENRPTIPTSKPILAGLDWRIVVGIGLTVFFWASAFAGIRAGLRAYTPEHLALLRYLTASVFLLGYALVTRMPMPHVRDIPGIALTGSIGIGLYNITLNAGEVGLSAGTASLIVACAPIFVALIATLFMGERLRMWGWLGIAASFSGVAVIALSSGEGLELNSGALLVLVAAMAQSFFVVRQKPFLKRYTPLQFTAYSIWAATASLLIFLPGLFDQVQAAPMDLTLAVVYMGIFPGAIGYIAWAYVLARVPASIAASFLYLVPAIAIGIAWLWLGEVPSLIAIIGGGFVLLGVIIVNTRGKVK